MVFSRWITFAAFLFIAYTFFSANKGRYETLLPKGAFEDKRSNATADMSLGAAKKKAEEIVKQFASTEQGKKAIGTVFHPQGQGEAAPIPLPVDYTDVLVTENEKALCGQTVELHYAIGTESNTKITSTKDAGKPQSVTLGNHQVIKGLEYGIPGMGKGSVRRITIPPALAYDDPRFQGLNIAKGQGVVAEVQLLAMAPPLPLLGKDETLQIFTQTSGTGKPVGCGQDVVLDMRITDNNQQALVSGKSITVTLDKRLPVAVLRILETMQEGSVKTAIVPVSYLKTLEGKTPAILQKAEGKLPAAGTVMLEVTLKASAKK